MDRPTDALAGVTVLVTRPAHQADNLCRLIEASGGQVLRFPVLAIAETSDPDALDSLLRRLDQFKIAVFISANAVDFALNRLQVLRTPWPKSLRTVAVGKASAKALNRFGLSVDLTPSTTFNTEGLLEEPELQSVAGKKIVIFRGEGGRELLAQTLAERGAEIEYAQCYRRLSAAPDQTRRDALLSRWARGEVDVVTVTSNETLRNLFEMLGGLGQKWLQQTPLIGISERIRVVAKELGFSQIPRVAALADDNAMVAELIQWRLEQRGKRNSA